jgi:hypothetical protein
MRLDKSDLSTRLQPVLDAITALPAGPGAAAALNTALPLEHPAVRLVFEAVQQGLEDGWLCPREANGVRFGRPVKPGPDSRGFSVDAVVMAGAGPGHTHPAGEFDLCFVLDGAPRFDGNPPGWTVYGPGTWHVPTVTGGTMVILYFLPEGSIRFEDAPPAGQVVQ